MDSTEAGDITDDISKRLTGADILVYRLISTILNIITFA